LLGWLKFLDLQYFDPVVFDERHGLHHRSLEIFADNGVGAEIIPWGIVRNLPGALAAVASRVRAAWPCIVHTHEVRSDFVALIVGRMTKVPVVVPNHARHAVGLKRHIFEACRGFWLRYADMVVNVSADTDRETARRGVP
jgi:hypothetical protein